MSSHRSAAMVSTTIQVRTKFAICSLKLRLVTACELSVPSGGASLHSNLHFSLFVGKSSPLWSNYCLYSLFSCLLYGAISLSQLCLRENTELAIIEETEKSKAKEEATLILRLLSMRWRSLKISNSLLLPLHNKEWLVAESKNQRHKHEWHSGTTRC